MLFTETGDPSSRFVCEEPLKEVSLLGTDTASRCEKESFLPSELRVFMTGSLIKGRVSFQRGC